LEAALCCDQADLPQMLEDEGLILKRSSQFSPPGIDFGAGCWELSQGTLVFPIHPLEKSGL